VAEMGFDVVYLTPIHPIGHTNRKGRDNSPVAGPGDPGSPWSIGDESGGHDAVHPDLGTTDDVRSLTRAAATYGIEIALDFAINCSADHPWLRQHPEWFNHRPDGTLKYAENPPKRYQDIYNVNWDSEDWKGLWEALLSVVLHWVDCGIRVFRVDNPHTKPAPFWAWLIDQVHARDRDVVFLSEAFTRRPVMQQRRPRGVAGGHVESVQRCHRAAHHHIRQRPGTALDPGNRPVVNRLPRQRTTSHRSPGPLHSSPVGGQPEPHRNTALRHAARSAQPSEALAARRSSRAAAV